MQMTAKCFQRLERLNRITRKARVRRSKDEGKADGAWRRKFQSKGAQPANNGAARMTGFMDAKAQPLPAAGRTGGGDTSACLSLVPEGN